MATGSDVLTMLVPTGGWVIYGDDFSSIIYDKDITPISKKDFEEGFAKFDEWKLQQDNAASAAKAALLSKLGITADEAALLLG